MDADRPDTPAEAPKAGAPTEAPAPAEASTEDAPAVEDETAAPAENGAQAAQAEAAGTGAQAEAAEAAAPVESWAGDEYQHPNPGYYGAPYPPWDMSIMTGGENPYMACLNTINQLTALLAATQLGRAPPFGETQELNEARRQLAETQRQLAETQQQLAETEQHLAGAKGLYYELQERFRVFMCRPPLPKHALRACLDARGHCEHCAAFKSVEFSPEGGYKAAICGDCIERIQRASKCGAPNCEKRPYVSPLGEVSPYCADCWSAVEQQVLASKATEELLPAVDKALEFQRAVSRNAVPDVLGVAKRQVQALESLRSHTEDVCGSTVELRKRTLRRKNVSDAKAAAKAARKRQADAAAI